MVNATRASGYTTTATGPGLVYTAVGYPTYFIVTVRDAYDNVLVHHTPAVVNITMKVGIWQHNRSTHPINTPAQYILSTYSITFPLYPNL